MKKILLLLIATLSGHQALYNQTITSNGKPIAEIFTDFHISVNDTSKRTGFNLNRAYLGYTFLPEGNFSGTIIVNAGSPEDLAPGSEPRRYAYIREASICYSNEKVKAFLGITGTRLFDFQQRFWGKRYIANTYQSINGYGFVADLGFVIDYQISEILKADFTLMNGEGYNNIQIDKSLKSSLGFTITPDHHFAIRIYADIIRSKGLWQPMLLGFIGFKNGNLTIGGEVTYKSNLDLNRGHHAFGISGTGSVNVAKKDELFARLDYSTSVIPSGDINSWNYLNDGNFLVIGLQHMFSDNVKIALDYQGIYPFAPDLPNSKGIFVNALFRF